MFLKDTNNFTVTKADTLTTARTINGTSFNGSANITTANWGTARNIYIADNSATNTGPAVSVNGSANATLKLPATIKAALSGNATTATTLATARTIGKASFNGSANITLSQIMGHYTTTSSGNGTYNNKWTKFATIDLSGGTYRECAGQFIFTSKEADTFSGTLQFYLRTGSAITSTSISLKWTELSNSSYATTVAAVKVSDGKFDLYFKPIANYTQMNITAFCQQVGYLTLYSNQSYVDSVTAAATSSLSGYVYNASTANTLATARTINGTSFNGSANITTANWGTARTLTIGSTGKSVNGSGNVTWTLSEIGAAAASHTHNYAGSSSAGGAANSANTLATARTINGTSFNGSANITTANWGTARTLTIGSTGKSVNGSGNVSWTLSEIGAAAASHTHSYLPLSGGTLTGRLTANGKVSAPTTGGSWIGGMTLTNATIGISTQQTSNQYHPILAVKTSGNHVANIGGLGDNFGFYGFKSGRTENATDWSFVFNASSGAVTSTAAITAPTFNGALNGNATTATTATKANALTTARTINGTSFNGSANITTANWGTARNIYIADNSATNTGPAVSVNGSGNATLKLPATIKAALTGNATTATTLATARTINGTSFNGSANITTAKWGTARTLSLTGLAIGSASVDGSANVSISTTLKTPASGAWWNGGAAIVSGDGVTEVGKYIDFHHTNTTTSDYSTRLMTSSDAKNVISLPTGSGMVALTETLNGYWGMKTPEGSNSSWIRTTSSGIIPYQSGGASSLGTESWPFNAVHTNSTTCPVFYGYSITDSNYSAKAGFKFHFKGTDAFQGSIDFTGVEIGYDGFMETVALTFPGTYGGVSCKEIVTTYITASSTAKIAGVSPYANKNNTYALGTSSYRWSDVYCNRGAFNGSDKALKDDIKSIAKNDRIRNSNNSTYVTSEDLYDYIKNTPTYTFKYKGTNDYVMGVIANEIPDNIFNLLGKMSKTEEEYQQEKDNQPKYKEIYESALEHGVYENGKEEFIHKETGLSYAEIKSKAFDKPEAPVRLLNPASQVAMLQEVLSMALNKIEELNERIEVLENN